MEYSFELIAAVTRAIARQPAKRIAALPDGELTVQRLMETQVSDAGRSLSVVLYAVTGMTTHPVLSWLTNDTEQRLFAYIYPGYMRVIEQGWELQGAALENLQMLVRIPAIVNADSTRW